MELKLQGNFCLFLSSEVLIEIRVEVLFVVEILELV